MFSSSFKEKEETQLSFGGREFFWTHKIIRTSFYIDLLLAVNIHSLKQQISDIWGIYSFNFSLNLQPLKKEKEKNNEGLASFL